MCTLVHFGENTVVWGHLPGADKWGIVGTLAPKGTTDTPARIFVSPKLLAVEIWTHMRVSKPYWWHAMGGVKCGPPPL